jgi:mono/diheme cytochrome c family protein
MDLRRIELAAAALTAAALTLASMPARGQGAAEMLAEYSAKAGRAASADRGQKFFATNFGRDLGFSCASCHGPLPTRAGKDQVTDKPIAPLAPSANAKRFTDRTRVEYMFRMNCMDVVGRECNAGEKADVIAWLVSLKP